MTTPTGQLPRFPMERQSPYDPPPSVLQLLRDEPVSRVVLWDGQEAWLVTRYDDVRNLLTNPDLSADVRKPGYPKVSAALAHFTEGLLNHMDSPEHDVYRRMLAPDFMVKRVESLRGDVEKMVDDLLDAMQTDGAPVDLVASFAFPIPALVTCSILGVPYDRKDFFVHCAEAFLSGTSTAEAAAAAGRDLHAYLGELIEAKKAAPGTDTLSRMVTEYVARGELDETVLVTLAELLLIAGFDTTANMIALGTLTLLRHPDQLDELKAHPELWPGAVEELLRFLTITHRGRHRVATADIMVGGQLIRAGEGIIAAQDAANRDPATFPDPDVLDIHREARHHLAFGHGVHQCIGAAVARVELQVAYARLFARFPELELAVPQDQIRFKHESSVYGVAELPVRW
jgi:cytochrome P450